MAMICQVDPDGECTCGAMEGERCRRRRFHLTLADRCAFVYFASLVGVGEAAYHGYKVVAALLLAVAIVALARAFHEIW